jgi:hypothetical protein
LLVEPERLTPSDFLPEEAGEDDTTLLLATGVRPDEPVVAHVLVHLLQLARAGGEYLGETTDEWLAGAALAEGEANLVAVLYLFRSMGLGDSVTDAGLDPGAVLQGALVPADVRTRRDTAAALARFAYRDGFALVAESYRRGGWAAVDRLWGGLRATRDVLHAATDHPAPVRPEPPGIPLPERYELRDRDRLGEQAIVVLVSRGSGKDNLGLLAGDGWAGDALYRWEPDGAPEAGVTAWVTRWTSPEQAADFTYGFSRVLRARFGTAADAVPDGVWFRSGTADRPVLLQRRGDRVVVWISPPALAPSADGPGSQGPDPESG